MHFGWREYLRGFSLWRHMYRRHGRTPLDEWGALGLRTAMGLLFATWWLSSMEGECDRSDKELNQRTQTGIPPDVVHVLVVGGNALGVVALLDSAIGRKPHGGLGAEGLGSPW